MIRIVEVGPRDGLQNESRLIPTDVKVAFVDALSATGLDEIEVSSFVSPRWVPQLEDAEEVFRRIERREGVIYAALVPNLRGLERAQEVSVDKLSVFTAATETFNRKNINASISESIERFRPVLQEAGETPVRGYVSTAFHCPYEGPVAPEDVVEVVQRLLDLGCVEISIGDTIGLAVPDEIDRLLHALLPVCPPERLALHLHDTYGRALDNAHRAAEHGIFVFDASTGGIGGCPYAPGASGNVSTEKLVAAFADRVSVDPVALAEAADVIRPHVGVRTPTSDNPTP